MAETRVTLPTIKGRVMIVHDILYIRHQVKLILYQAGVRDFSEPKPGGDAYVTMLKNPEGFSLVIDDLDSNPSGLILLKMLRKDPGTPEILQKIPFIMLLSNADPQNISEVMNCGASGILLKPFNGLTLLKTVKRVLEK
jgi:two-component system chemotaxis response regulator CheY